MSSATATAPTLLSSRRQQLSPMKPNAMKSLRNSNKLKGDVKNMNSCPTATKRTHSQNDENSDVLSALPTATKSSRKRVKSALSDSLNAVLKSAISSASSSNLVGPKPKRAFGTLVDITNTRAGDKSDSITGKAPSKSRGALAEKNSSKSVKPARTVLSPKKASPITHHKQTSPSRRSGVSARVRAPPSPRRSAIKPPAFRRIDPPSFGPAAIDSIDSLLAAVSRPSKLALFVDPPPSADVAARKAAEPVPLMAPNIPDSWAFEIYEDSPEETLQNLMEHSTCTLDISDDSDDDESVTSELHEKGKENIAPARLAELLAVAPIERGNAMRVDAVEKTIPQRRGSRRDPLREMLKEELALPEKTPAVENNLPTLASDRFPVFTPPKKERGYPHPHKLGDVTPKSPDSPGFVVWESDHEEDEEAREDGVDEAAIAAGVALPDDEVDLELERELADQEFESWGNDADSLGGSSDSEI